MEIEYLPTTNAAILTDLPVARFLSPDGKVYGIRCVRIGDQPRLEAILGGPLAERLSAFADGGVSGSTLARLIEVALVEEAGPGNWVPAPDGVIQRWPIAWAKHLSELTTAFFKAALGAGA